MGASLWRSERGKETNTALAKKGGTKGGAASASRPPAARSASAKKGAETRARNRTQQANSHR